MRWLSKAGILIFFLDLLHRQEDRLKGPDQQDALSKLEENQENLRVAWLWAIDRGRSEPIAQAQWSIGNYHEWQGRYREGVDLFQKMAELAKRADDLILLMQAQLWQANFCRVLAMPERARPLLDECERVLNLHRLAGVDTGAVRADIQLFRARLAQDAGDGPGAIQHCEESIRFYQRLDDPWNEARALVDLCWILRDFGESGTVEQRRQQLAKAEQAIRQSLSICRELEDRTGIAHGLVQFGLIQFFQGQLDQCMASFEESLALSWESENQTEIVMSLFGLAAASLGARAYQDTRRYASQALELAEENGLYYRTGVILSIIGLLALIEAGYTEARDILLRSLEMNRRMDNQHEQAISLGILALAEHQLGLAESAWQRMRECLQIGRTIRSWWPIWLTCSVVTRLLWDEGGKLRALELCHFLSGFDGPLGWQASKDWLGLSIQEMSMGLDPAAVASAQEQGRQRNLWDTAQELMAVVEERLANR